MKRRLLEKNRKVLLNEDDMFADCGSMLFWAKRSYVTCSALIAARPLPLPGERPGHG